MSEEDLGLVIMTYQENARRNAMSEVIKVLRSEIKEWRTAALQREDPAHKLIVRLCDCLLAEYDIAEKAEVQTDTLVTSERKLEAERDRLKGELEEARGRIKSLRAWGEGNQRLYLKSIDRGDKYKAALEKLCTAVEKKAAHVERLTQPLTDPMPHEEVRANWWSVVDCDVAIARQSLNPKEPQEGVCPECGGIGVVSAGTHPIKGGGVHHQVRKVLYLM